MKGKLISTLVLVYAVTVSAQQPIFNITYGTSGFERFRSVTQTSDGGFIAAGECSGFGNGNKDVYVVKTDGAGDTIWTSRLGGSNAEEAVSVQEVNQGQYLVTGFTQSFGSGSYDVYLALLDVTGDTLFTRAYGDANPQYIVGNSAKAEKTYEGGYILAATAYDSGFVSMHTYIIKTDSAGNLLWAKSYYSIGVERAWSIQRTGDTTYLITGITSATPNSDADVFLMKIDGNGNLIWGKTYGSSGGEEGVSLNILWNGDCIIYGTSSGFNSNGYADLLIIRTDASGNILWSNLYTVSGIITLACSGVVDANGNLLIAGAIRNLPADFSALAVKTDGAGNLLWAKELPASGVNESFMSVGVCLDGSYIFAGGTDSYGAGNWDALLSRIGPNGETACNFTTPLITMTPITLTTGTFTAVPMNIGVASGTNSGRFYLNYPITMCSGFVDIQESPPARPFSVFPNPAASTLTISINNLATNSAGIKSIFINDSYGRIVLSKDVAGDDAVIDISMLTSGVYYLVVSDGVLYYNERIVITGY